MTASAGRPGITHTIKELRWRWGEAYDINWDWQSKVYRACRRDDGTALEHTDSEGLWQLIRRDYAANPVARG